MNIKERGPIKTSDIFLMMHDLLQIDRSKEVELDLEINFEKVRLILLDTPPKDFSDDPNRGVRRNNRRAAIGLFGLAAVINQKFGENSTVVIDMD